MYNIPGIRHEERDMVALQHIFLVSCPAGSEEVIRSRMLDFGTFAADTSIARTAALPFERKYPFLILF